MSSLSGVFTATGISKGQSNLITLNKASLNALFTDAYFNTVSNWKQVIASYQTSEGQRNSVLFDASEASPTGDFNPTDKSIDALWEIQSIVISDFDGGYFKLNRSELTVGDFDIDFNAAPAPGGFWDALTAGSLNSANNGLYGGAATSSALSKRTTGLPGDFSITYYVDTTSDRTGMFFGDSDNPTVDAFGNYSGLEITGTTSIGVYKDGALQGSFSFTASATTEFRFYRTGTTIFIEIDGLVVWGDSIASAYTAYPTVRPYGAAEGVHYQTDIV